MDLAHEQPANRVRRSVGRPRLHTAEAEREIIFDAAYAAMRVNGTQGVSIAEILDGAGVSTRSFYRHFQSKDELLCAMYRRDAERSAARLERRLATTSTPGEAVELWIDEILGFMHVKTVAERVTVLGSIVANRAVGSEEESRHSRALLLAPLTEAIERGVADGTFTSTNPAGDSQMVAAAVFDAAGMSTTKRRRPTAAERHAVHMFCLRALGCEPGGR